MRSGLFSFAPSLRFEMLSSMMRSSKKIPGYRGTVGTVGTYLRYLRPAGRVG